MADTTTVTETAAGAVELEWGAPVMNAIGVVQNTGINTSAETSDARNEAGKIIEKRAYSRTIELSVEALVTAGKTPPKAGDKVEVTSFTDTTLNGVYLCTGANTTRANTDYAKVSITLQKADDMSLFPYGEKTRVDQPVKAGSGE